VQDTVVMIYIIFESDYRQ